MKTNKKIRLVVIGNGMAEMRFLCVGYPPPCCKVHMTALPFILKQ